MLGSSIRLDCLRAVYNNGSIGGWTGGTNLGWTDAMLGGWTGGWNQPPSHSTMVAWEDGSMVLLLELVEGFEQGVGLRALRVQLAKDLQGDTQDRVLRDLRA